jgi:hypothetical protein
MSFIHDLFLFGNVLRGPGNRLNLYNVSLSNFTLPSLNHSFLYTENDSASRKRTAVTVIIGSFIFNLVSNGALFDMFYLNKIYDCGN